MSEIKNISEHWAGHSFQEVESFIKETMGAVRVSWSALKVLRDGGKLIPSQLYRIIDYVTTTAQAETQSAGHPFDVIVCAIDNSMLSEDALAVRHDGDTYFQNAKLEAWRLKYTIDNDYDRFSWCQRESITISNKEYLRSEADDVSGANYPYCWAQGTTKRYTNTVTPTAGTDVAKGNTAGTGTNYQIQTVSHIDGTQRGVIYWMQDEWGNECGYDFKNIQFKRYKITADTKETNLTDKYVGFRVVTADNSQGSLYPSGYTISTEDTAWRYTFDANGADMSLSKAHENNCHGNVIAAYRPIGNIAKQYLNNIVFCNSSANTSCYGNEFKVYCHSMAFDSGCSSNTFGQDCQSNTFGQGCSSNTFGQGCSSNTFGQYCSNNTFGQDCQSNTFGQNCYQNTFGQNCWNNTFGQSCSSNTFGQYCQYNTFGQNCWNNTFGQNCYQNTFGQGCSSNTFGQSCSSNTFGQNACNYEFNNDFVIGFKAIGIAIIEDSYEDEETGDYVFNRRIYAVTNDGPARSVALKIYEDDNAIVDQTVSIGAGQTLIYTSFDGDAYPSDSYRSSFTENGITASFAPFF